MSSPESTNSKTSIILAIISAIVAISVALISNSDKLSKFFSQGSQGHDTTTTQGFRNHVSPTDTPLKSPAPAPHNRKVDTVDHGFGA